ncbi:hypothetical protein [Roseibium alexandrii]|uniref:hypothetical protein n=1 Tax=Roseibium alexandrii TaxID=388408 RepID=UPI0037501961
MNGRRHTVCKGCARFQFKRAFHPMTVATTFSTLTVPPANQPLSASKSQFDMAEIKAELARRYEDWKALPEDQKLRHLKLEKHGLREQDLDSLPEAERVRFEQKIAEVSQQPVFAPTSVEGAQRSALFKPVVSLASVLAISNAPHADAGEPAGARENAVFLANSIDVGQEIKSSRY